LAIGGFGVDYPADPTNPILGPRPFGGFGQIFSNYGLMKITPTISFAATERLWIGASANIDYANLTVDPMPVGAPAIDPGTGTAFFSSASAADGAFGFGFQAGLIFHVNDMISLGGMYQSATNFEDFEFNTTWANPNIAPPAANAFGFPRTINFNLDVPAVVGGGLSIRPLPQLLIAGDYRYIMYSSTDGFELPAGAPSPFNADGSVSGFGWDDISSINIGADFRASEQVSLRAGYNVSQNPVPDSLAMINLPSPAIVKNHITFGIGVRPSRRFEISAAYYRAFENSGTGPILNPAAPPGATVTNSLSENSFLLQFTWATRGSL
jgi:long-chain fatty acid transport protein